jgi:hypothetical protein
LRKKKERKGINIERWKNLGHILKASTSGAPDFTFFG